MRKRSWAYVSAELSSHGAAPGAISGNASNALHSLMKEPNSVATLPSWPRWRSASGEDRLGNRVQEDSLADEWYTNCYSPGRLRRARKHRT